jgi:hypothetical protein
MSFHCVGSIIHPGFNGKPRPHDIWMASQPGPAQAEQAWTMIKARYYADYAGPPPGNLAAAVFPPRARPAPPPSVKPPSRNGRLPRLGKGRAVSLQLEASPS